MNIEDADSVLKELLDPLPLESFFHALGRATLDVQGGPDHPRAALLGSDPVRTALDAYATHSERLDCHGVAPAPALLQNSEASTG